MKLQHSPKEYSPKTRTEFFDCERQAWTELSLLWHGLPDEDLLRSGACGHVWSVKDVINHVAAWQEAALRAVDDLMHARWARLGLNSQKFNALNFEADRDRTLAATRRRLSRSRRELLAMLGTVPVKGLLNIYGRQQIGWWAKYATYGHYAEHIQLLTEFRWRIKSRSK